MVTHAFIPPDLSRRFKGGLFFRADVVAGNGGRFRPDRATEAAPDRATQTIRGPADVYLENRRFRGHDLAARPIHELSGQRRVGRSEHHRRRRERAVFAVDPTDRNKMAIGWRQFDSVASNFRQASWGYTSNGGTSWTFPAVRQADIFRSDPVLASHATGRFFYLSLLSTFFTDLWRSLNGGQSWTRLGAATGGDKQWFTIDTTSSTGRGFQYQWWSTASNNYEGRQFSRSIDGGFTWMNPINVPNSPVWGTLDVNTNGDLFIGGVDSNLGQIWCVRSTNAKHGAVTPTFDLAIA